MPGFDSFAPFAHAPLAAMLPIVWLFLSLGVVRMQAWKACFFGLALSLLQAGWGWGMPPILLGKAALDGAIFALFPILWVILAAFFAYNISLSTQAIEQIKMLLASVSHDRRIQALLIAWGFGSFMEGVAGFGTAVAVPAALLIALGFEPFLAAMVCLLANTVAVAFGVVGVPVITLAQVTDLPVQALSGAVVWQLMPFVLCVPALIVLMITKSLRGLLEIWPHALAAGVGYGLAQYLAARYIGPELPAIIGSLAASGAIVLFARLFPPKRIWGFAKDESAGEADSAGALAVRDQLRAWSPYILLLVLVFFTSKLFPSVNGFLGQVRSSWLIYDGLGGKPFSIAWLLTPGTLVMIAAVVGGRIQGAAWKNLGAILKSTAWQLRKTALTILCIVAMAKVLGHSGMTMAIAGALAATAGGFYGLVSPLLGMLGTFLTGSDTSANILFGQLQKEVALKIGGDPIWMAAANTSGACIGKLISPQSLAIVSIATGLADREGELLRAALRYALACVIAMGLLVFLAS